MIIGFGFIAWLNIVLIVQRKQRDELEKMKQERKQFDDVISERKLSITSKKSKPKKKK